MEGLLSHGVRLIAVGPIDAVGIEPAEFGGGRGRCSRLDAH
jgi:hypothetical protein